jgi:AcrR family transcriptional regulator
VVDAALDLLRERGEQPSAQEIADRAGVSLRTVFRHYDDMDSLLATAIQRQVQRVGHLFQPMGPMDADAFVDLRAQLFEEISGARRAAMQNEGRPVVREGLAWAHRQLRSQVEAAFDVTGDLLEAVDAATSWWAWYALRFQQGLDVPEARRVMARTVARLLDDR